VLTEYMVHTTPPSRTARPRPARPGSSSHPATADQPRRAPDPPQTNPRRTHARVPDRRLTASRCYKKRAGHLHDRVFEPHRVIVVLRGRYWIEQPLALAMILACQSFDSAAGYRRRVRVPPVGVPAQEVRQGSVLAAGKFRLSGCQGGVAAAALGGGSAPG
jgi:hypothetical protein